jgi:dTMP kinase
VFITLEGIDRSGKTTQAALLADALGDDTLLLREPGGTPLGERIREILKDPELEIGAGVELLLFSAARGQLMGDVIVPALEAGRDVICDRFVDSSVAYQGAVGGLGVEHVEEFNARVTQGLMPDLTLLLRVDPERAEARGQGRLEAGEADGTDRFEREGRALQRGVAEAYDEIARRHSERIVVIDAEGEPEAVHARVMAAVEERRQ